MPTLFLTTIGRFGGSSLAPTHSPKVMTRFQLHLGQLLRAHTQWNLKPGFLNYSVSNVWREKSFLFLFKYIKMK